MPQEIPAPAILSLSGLAVAFRDRSGSPRQVLSDVGIDLHSGQIVGLAGESGSGKSTTALSLMGMSIAGSTRLSGELELDGRELFGLPLKELAKHWGPDISYVAQGASASLNPLRRIGFLVTEPMRVHTQLGKDEARERAVALLDRMGIAEPAAAMRRYPHEFSGGQQQRIALAIALACDPEVLLLDEPTSGLDVTTQTQINALLVELVRDRNLAALCISHDLAALRQICDRLVIMYGGEVVERGQAEQVLAAPKHPYTAALAGSIPRITDSRLPAGVPGRPPTHVVDAACAFAPRCTYALDACRERHPELEPSTDGREVRCLRTAELGVLGRTLGVARPPSAARPSEASLLAVRDVSCTYDGEHPVVKGASFDLAAGGVLALVGESGSGKSTIVRTIAGLHPPQSGTITYDGVELPSQASRRSRELRRDIQLVFQNADTSLNPRHTVWQLVSRPLTLFDSNLSRAQRQDRVDELLTRLTLDTSILDRRPHELSGGQRQRVALARAFASNPRLLLCDEVTSALDVSVAATVLNSLVELVTATGAAMVFVTHNLAVVPSIADRVVVMQKGEIVEAAPTREVLAQPKNAYTRSLLAAAEVLSPDPVSATTTS